MTLRELKEKLNEFPPEMDDCVVIFGEAIWGEKIKKVKKLGKKIILSFT